MRPSYILIPIIAAAVAISTGDQGYGWPFVMIHFLIALLLIAAFAKIGTILFGRRR